jgi:hypothetical protein
MNIITDHPATVAISAYFVFSAIVSGMPMYTDKSSIAYTWFFHTSHILAGNLQTVIAARFPSVSTASITHTDSISVKVPAENQVQTVQ